MQTSAQDKDGDAAQLVSPVRALLEAFEKAGLAYCIWKSFDRFEEGEQAKTDVDLLLPEGMQKTWHDILHHHGWFPAYAEPWRSYPAVFDYFLINPALPGIHHLHIHEQLVMGDRRLKNFTPPLVNLYLRSAPSQDGLRIAHPALECLVYLLRCAQKAPTLDCILAQCTGRSLARQFSQEFLSISKRCTPEDLRAMLHEPEFAFLSHDLKERLLENLSHNLNREDLLFSPNFLKQLRAASMEFLRVRPAYQANFQRLLRYWQRRTIGYGRRLASGGFDLALLGIDGSGKSTLLAQLENFLKTQLKVESFYLGSSQHRRGLLRSLFRISCLPLYALSWRLARYLRLVRTEIFLKKIFSGTEALLIRWEKAGLLRKAQQAKRAGALVLYDRFPLFAGSGDGIACSNIPLPDVLLYLKLDAKTAYSRKSEQDVQELLQKQHALEEHLQSLKSNQAKPALIILTLDASAPREEVFRATLEGIAALCLRQG